jgi:protein ImuB
MRRVLSLWLYHWPTDLLHRRAGAEAGGPLVAVATIGNRRILVAVDAAAAAAGLAPGLGLADARARRPDLVAREADQAGAAAALASLADWCGGYSPWTATEGVDGVWLDITGCVPLFAGEDELAADLLARLRRRGFSCRAAIADTPGAAWALARWGTAPETGALIAAPGGTRAALAGLPVAALRLGPEIAQDLRRLGLRRIDSLYALPRAPLAPRFGEIVARRLDQALGLIAEPISPRRPTVPRLERRAWPEPILAPEDLQRGTRLLLERLCARLEREGLGARRLELCCYRVDCRVERVEIGTSGPSRDPAHLMRLFAPRIETIAPDLGIEIMTMTALEVETLAARQLDFERAGAGDPAAPLIDRLANRLGSANVLRLVPFSSHVPERAVRAVPALVAPHALGPWPAGRKRPIRLLEYPDPVEVVAPIPDDPPLSFRWRRVVHRVRHAEGPERIAAEWWRDPKAAGEDETRDYYRVEDEAGSRFWLYRRGLYRGPAPPRWFLHGFFP